MISVGRCRCGHPACHDWHVGGYAATQGVKFTENEARAVAHLMWRPELVSQFAEAHKGEEAIARVASLEAQMRSASETIADLMTPRTASNVLEVELALESTPEAESLRVAIKKYAEAKGWD